MIPFIGYVLFGLFQAVTAPPILALEAASVWLEGHPLAVWAAGIMGLCCWFVSLYQVDISDEVLR